MAIQISEYINVEERAKELGLESPSAITFIPRHFSTAENRSELVHEASVSTLRKLFRQNGLPESKLDLPDNKIPYCHENDFDWIAPVISISWSILIKNPDVIKTICKLIQDYLTEYFKGIKKDHSIKLETIIEKDKNKTFVSVSYQGYVSGLKDIPGVIHEALND